MPSSGRRGKSDNRGDKHGKGRRGHDSSSSSSDCEEVTVVTKKIVERKKHRSCSRSRSRSSSSSRSRSGSRDRKGGRNGRQHGGKGKKDRSCSRSKSRSCSPDKKHCGKKDRSCSRSRSRSCSSDGRGQEKTAHNMLSHDQGERKQERSNRRRRGGKKHGGGKGSGSDSDCFSDSDRSCSDNDKSCSDVESCSDDEYDNKKWCDEDQWYCYMKKKLLKDPSLLAAGSDAFGSFYSTSEQKIALSAPVLWENSQSAYNVDLDPTKGAIQVRKDGVYYFAFSVSPTVASQWTLFVNEMPIMTKGIASGGGQLLMFKVLELKANDQLNVRNFSSGIGEVALAVDIGGSVAGTNVEIVIRKIGPLQVLDRYTRAKRLRLSRKAKRLFECIEKKMFCDPELMIGGSSSYGSYWSTLVQDVAVEAPVLFEQHQNMKCQEHALGSGSVCVKEDGTYTFVFLAEPDRPSQFTFFVNGNAIQNSTQGTNSGATFLMLRQQLPLKCGDKVEIRNHTSTAGTVTLTRSPGGLAVGQSALLILYKIAPAPCDLQCPVPLECWCNKKIEKKNKRVQDLAGNISESDLDEDKPRIKRSPYKLFKNFLLCQSRVDIDGVTAYQHAVKTLDQSLAAGDAMSFRTAIPPKNGCHVTGLTPFQVKKRGIYEIVFDTQTVQPAQFTVFNKECPIDSAISGSNSGANEVVVSQLLCLDCGDCLTVRNWKSFVNPVDTQINPGGHEVAENSSFTILRIAPSHRRERDCNKPRCDKNDKPK